MAFRVVFLLACLPGVLCFLSVPMIPSSLSGRARCTARSRAKFSMQLAKDLVDEIQSSTRQALNQGDCLRGWDRAHELSMNSVSVRPWQAFFTSLVNNQVRGASCPRIGRQEQRSTLPESPQAQAMPRSSFMECLRHALRNARAKRNAGGALPARTSWRERENE